MLSSGQRALSLRLSDVISRTVAPCRFASMREAVAFLVAGETEDRHRLNSSLISPQEYMEARAEAIAVFFADLGEPCAACVERIGVNTFGHQNDLCSRERRGP